MNFSLAHENLIIFIYILRDHRNKILKQLEQINRLVICIAMKKVLSACGLVFKIFLVSVQGYVKINFYLIKDKC